MVKTFLVQIDEAENSDAITSEELAEFMRTNGEKFKPIS